MMPDAERNEIVPYGSAYGVENHLVQERLKSAAAVVKFDHSTGLEVADVDDPAT